MEAHIAEDAHKRGITLKEAALDSGKIDEQTFDRVIDARKMIGNGVAGA